MFLHVRLDKFGFVEAFDCRHAVTHVLNNFLHVSTVSCNKISFLLEVLTNISS